MDAARRRQKFHQPPPAPMTSLERRLTQHDFDRFARLSHDDNPIHCDPAFAARSHFGATVAHGMFLYANLSRALAAVSPGAVAYEQELMFPAPSFVGDSLLFVAELHEARADGTQVFTTRAAKADGLGAEGYARICPAGAAAPRPAGLTARTVPGGAPFFGLACGQRATSHRRFTAADLTEYAALTGDRAADVPGPLLAAMFSDLLGTRLPGRGTGWMKQRLAFLRPARVGEELLARVEVIRLRPDKELANLATTITDADGQGVVDGEALVLVRNLEDKVGGKGGRDE